MAVAKWAAPRAASSVAGTALNSLANGSTTARMAYDNGTNRDLYARVTVDLGSITPSTGGSITLRYLSRYSGADEDIVTSLESYTALLTTTTGAKKVIFGMVRLYPFDGGFVLRNDSGVTLNASGNTINVEGYNEDVT